MIYIVLYGWVNPLHHTYNLAWITLLKEGIKLKSDEAPVIHYPTSLHVLLGLTERRHSPLIIKNLQILHDAFKRFLDPD